MLTQSTSNVVNGSSNVLAWDTRTSTICSHVLRTHGWAADDHIWCV